MLKIYLSLSKIYSVKRISRQVLRYSLLGQRFAGYRGFAETCETLMWPKNESKMCPVECSSFDLKLLIVIGIIIKWY